MAPAPTSAKAAAAPAAKATKPKVSRAEQVKTAKAKRAEGLTLAEIAVALKVSPSTVRTMLGEGSPEPAAKQVAATKKAEASEAKAAAPAKVVEVASTETPITCRGVCGETKPAKVFPTTTGPLKRSTECRACRDTRRNPAEAAPAETQAQAS